MITLKISSIERTGPLVNKLRKAFEDRLDELRRLNDRDASEAETAKIRGRISEIKAILKQLSDSDEPDEDESGPLRPQD